MERNPTSSGWIWKGIPSQTSAFSLYRRESNSKEPISPESSVRSPNLLTDTVGRTGTGSLALERTDSSEVLHSVSSNKNESQASSTSCAPIPAITGMFYFKMPPIIQDQTWNRQHSHSSSSSSRTGESGSVPQTSSSSESTTTFAKKIVRKRSAAVEELKYEGRLTEKGTQFHNIRVWSDDSGKKYYDCKCGTRKAVQDLNKIKKHILKHCRLPTASGAPSSPSPASAPTSSEKS